MAFKEFVQAEQEAKEAREATGDVPVFGDAYLAADKGATLDNTTVLFSVMNIGIPDERILAESLFTRSLRCQNQLRQAGDVCIFREETYFNKTGEYIVALKYATIEASSKMDTAASSKSSMMENFEI